MGLVDSLKDFYFRLEDSHYSLLDKIQTKIPVYAVVDPLDKVVPSFGIILVIVVGVLGVGLFSALGVLSLGGEKFSVNVTFNDALGGPLEEVHVSLEKDSQEIDFKNTNSSGSVIFSLPSGTYTLRASKDGFEDFLDAVLMGKFIFTADQQRQMVGSRCQEDFQNFAAKGARHAGQKNIFWSFTHRIFSSPNKYSGLRIQRNWKSQHPLRFPA